MRKLWPALLAAVILSWLSAAHPGLRLVDFIAFAGRARGLPAGNDLLNPLYPVGYPALLAVGKALTGDVLLAGRALSVIGGVIAVAAVSRWLSPWAGLWLLASAALLEWGGTAGTDMLAAGLSVAALAAARRRPALAGALLGAACMTRYTGLLVVPAAVLAARHRWRAVLLSFAVVTAPHWALALAWGRAVLPDQSTNLTIGGQHGALLSVQTLRRLPAGLHRAVRAVGMDWTVQLGMAGLVVGMLRRDHRAWLLAGAALCHLAAVGLVFVNPRLVLPATVMITAGAAFLIPRALLLAPAIAALSLHLRPAATLSPVEVSLQGIAAACAGLEGPILTTSPWLYTQRDGWLQRGILVRRLGDPRHLSPQALRQGALDWGAAHVAVDIGRVYASYPGLRPLVQREVPAGFSLVAKAPGWRVYRVE